MSTLRLAQELATTSMHLQNMYSVIKSNEADFFNMKTNYETQIDCLKKQQQTACDKYESETEMLRSKIELLELLLHSNVINEKSTAQDEYCP
jgi:hypothetical protein